MSTVSKVDVDSVESECRQCRKWMSKVGIDTIYKIEKYSIYGSQKFLEKATKYNISYSRVNKLYRQCTTALG